MPITYTISKNGGILVSGKGSVLGSDIKKINEAIYASPENILKIKFQLWDLTDVDKILLSSENIEAFAEQDAVAAKINTGMIIAIVVSSDLMYGLSRMWEAHSYSSPFKSMIFRNIEDAKNWIDSILGIPKQCGS